MRRKRQMIEMIKQANFLNSQENEDEERELIKKIQATGDPESLKLLRRKYQGLRVKAVIESGLPNVIGHNEAQQEGIRLFDELVRSNVDLSQNVKPHTYISNTLRQVLKNSVNDMKGSTARRSRDLQRQHATINIGMENFEKDFGRKPEAKELSDYIHNNMSFTSGIDESTIKRSWAYDRVTLSGNQELGGNELDEGADHMTFGEMAESEEAATPEDYMRDMMREQSIKRIISDKPYNEQKFIKEYLGMDNYTGGNKGNLGKASLNNNLTAYEARKILGDLRKKLEKEGVDIFG